MSTKHIVGFSGGIDSQACARWVLNRFPKDDVILLNSDAGGNESPATTQFIRDYSEQVHPVVVVEAKIKDIWRTEGWAETRGLDGGERLTFDRLIEIERRPPSSSAQFCTRILKLWPTKRWIEENITDDYCRYSGVRRDESRRRASTDFQQWDDFFDCNLYHPIADWTKQMCFDYCKAHGEPINPLYSLGFSRVGCAPCINSGKDDILAWLDRDPAMIDKVRAWEQRLGISFFPPMVPGAHHNKIDEVIEWAKTVRGGKQYGLHVLYERPSCESKYGLCE